MKNEDVALIHNILAGDETAFVTLVEKYQKQVHALAWRKTGDFHIAEEITQDTFLKVYQKLSTLKDPNQFSGWLYVIASRQCLTWLRKKRLETEPLEATDMERIDESAYSRYVAEERANDTVETQREVVKKLLAKLKESERTVMTLHYLGEMTTEEISRFLGVSTSAIKLRLHRARQRLQKEEAMIREALSNFKLSPYLTDNIIEKVRHVKPTAPSGSKPLIPWMIGASTALLLILIAGMGSQYLPYFQQSYSLDSQSELAVELIDVPIVLNLETNPDVRNQFGQNSDDTGKGDDSGQESSQVLSDKGDFSKWGLPDNAKARLGKGKITGNVAYSPDGTRLAVAGSIGIWIYDAQTLQELDFFKSLGSITQWRSNEELNLDKGHTRFIRSVCFSPNSKILASGGDDNKVVLWDISSGKPKAIFAGHTRGVLSVSFSPDGKTLACGGGDGNIVLWDVTTQQKKAVFGGHSGEIYSVKFSPDGKTLASGSGLELWLWDITKKKHNVLLVNLDVSIFSYDTAGEKKYKYPAVFCVSFNPDGNTLATGHRDNTVRLWDVDLRKHIATLKGHTDFVRNVSFSPNGKTLVSVSWDNTVRLWDVDTKREKIIFNAHTNYLEHVAFSTDGTTIATSGNKVHLWDAHTGKHKATLQESTVRINSVTYSPDGATIVSGHADNTVKLWDTATRKLKRTLTGHTGKVWCIDFSPDGKVLASGGYDNVVRLWDITTGKQKKTLIGHTNRIGYANYIRSVDFSSDEQTLASASGLEVYLWDVNTGEHKSIFNGHTGEVWIVQFSPDGKTLASGSSDKSIRLWDIATGKQKGILIGNSMPIRSLSFSPDGKIIANGSGYELCIWDIETGNLLTTLKGHQVTIRSVSFDPHGKLIATGSSDRTLRLWDLTTKQSLGIFKGHIDDVGSISFSPDGKTLASGSSDGTILLWDLDEVLKDSNRKENK